MAMKLDKTVPAPGDGIAIVVAVFDGAPTLAELASRVQSLIEGRDGGGELLLVNDGSTDDSWRIIEALAQSRSWIRGIDLSRNVGQHGALLCGIRHVRHPIIVTLDDDLQHAPEDIPRLLEALGPGVDLVYGIPLHQSQPASRILASWLLGWLLRLRGTGGTHRYSAFRAFRTQLRSAFDTYSGPQVSIDVLLSWGTTRAAMVRVDHHRPGRRRSRYSLRKLIGLAFETVVGFGIVSPALIAGMGGILSVLGLCGLLGGFFRTLDIAAVVVLCTGIQLCIASWLGACLMRTQAAVSGRPAYLIARTTSNDRLPDGSSYRQQMVETVLDSARPDHGSHDA